MLALRYPAETMKLRHLVPLLQMAWAEGGKVSAREQEVFARVTSAIEQAHGTKA
jgi:hypothetical protein